MSGPTPNGTTATTERKKTRPAIGAAAGAERKPGRAAGEGEKEAHAMQARTEPKDHGRARSGKRPVGRDDRRAA